MDIPKKKVSMTTTSDNRGNCLTDPSSDTAILLYIEDSDSAEGQWVCRFWIMANDWLVVTRGKAG